VTSTLGKLYHYNGPRRLEESIQMYIINDGSGNGALDARSLAIWLWPQTEMEHGRLLKRDCQAYA
jgi:hypothetical protein